MPCMHDKGLLRSVSGFIYSLWKFVYWLYDLLNIEDTLWGPSLCHNVSQQKWLPCNLEQWSEGMTEIHWPSQAASLASLLTGIDGVSMFPDFFLSPLLPPCSGPFFLFSSVRSSSRHQSIAIICSYPSPVMQASAFSTHHKVDEREGGLLPNSSTFPWCFLHRSSHINQF